MSLFTPPPDRPFAVVEAHFGNSEAFVVPVTTKWLRHIKSTIDNDGRNKLTCTLFWPKDDSKANEWMLKHCEPDSDDEENWLSAEENVTVYRFYRTFGDAKNGVEEAADLTDLETKKSPNKRISKPNRKYEKSFDELPAPAKKTKNNRDDDVVLSKKLPALPQLLSIESRNQGDQTTLKKKKAVVSSPHPEAGSSSQTARSSIEKPSEKTHSLVEKRPGTMEEDMNIDPDLIFDESDDTSCGQVTDEQRTTGSGDRSNVARALWTSTPKIVSKPTSPSKRAVFSPNREKVKSFYGGSPKTKGGGGGITSMAFARATNTINNKLDDITVRVNAVYLSVCSPLKSRDPSAEASTTPTLPIESKEELTAFETFVQDEQHKAGIVHILCENGGTDLRTIIYGIMKKLITNKLATQYNLHGNNRAGNSKASFKTLSAYTCVHAAAKVRSLQLKARTKTDCYDSKSADSWIANWLKDAPKRYSRGLQERGQKTREDEDEESTGHGSPSA